MQIKASKHHVKFSDRELIVTLLWILGEAELVLIVPSVREVLQVVQRVVCRVVGEGNDVHGGGEGQQGLVLGQQHLGHAGRRQQEEEEGHGDGAHPLDGHGQRDFAGASPRLVSWLVFHHHPHPTSKPDLSLKGRGNAFHHCSQPL